MASKIHVLTLITKHAPQLIEALQLNHCVIRWHVVSSKDKDLKKKGFDHGASDMACCIWNHTKKRNKTYDIVIYYDLHKSSKDIIASIFHELLHVRLRQWDTLIKKTRGVRRRHSIVEEKLVQTLEKLYIDLF